MRFKLISLFLLLFASTQGWTYPNSVQAPVTQIRHQYASTNVTTGAWVELVASLSQHVSNVEIFDTCGQSLRLGVGAAGSESTYANITPGGNGMISLGIAKSSRVAVRALSANCTTGELIINFYY